MNPTPEIPEGVAAYDIAAAALHAVIRGVAADQWSAPTPCTEWNVRMLVNHVVGGTLLFAAIIRGEPRPDRSRDHLGDDPAAAFASAAQSLHDAFVQPGVMEGIFQSPIGERPGSQLVQMRITEQLVHGWDLATATGQTLDVPPELVAQTVSALRERLPGGRRQGPMFADEQPCDEDALALDRLAAFLGRSVQGTRS
jgi:uncharacterized protein (TIGR03086 family)